MQATDFPLITLVELIADLHRRADAELAESRDLRKKGMSGSRSRLEAALAYSAAAHMAHAAYDQVISTIDRLARLEADSDGQRPCQSADERLGE